MPTLTDPRHSLSTERGLAILRCFTPGRSVLGIFEMADLTGISRSTTHRYVITLVALGYLEQCGVSRKYRLGLKARDPGMSWVNSTGLRGPSRPCLEELRERTSFTASMSILDGSEIMYVERAQGFWRGQQMINLNLGLASRLPAYCTSMGKVLLANLPGAELDELMANMTLTRRGPNTIMTKKALRFQLERVSEEGMAVNDEELARCLVSIACPVRNKDGTVVAAINLAAHSSMISSEEMEAQFLPHLLVAAEDISARLGFRHDDRTAL
jgi:IclR family transcriptional regulator, pca regulon regulatory protein